MKITIFLGLCAVLFGAAILPAPAQQKSNKGVEGIWTGKLSVSGIDLRLVVKVTKKQDGTLTGTMDSIDQGAKDIPISKVTAKDRDVKVEVDVIQGVFEGKLNAEGTELVGKWTQGPASLPLTLKRTDKAPVLNRPQEPKKPYPYAEEEVVYENKEANVKLAGTLTLPKGDGPFPAVVLITGSGPQDRNEELLGHKPFLVLADYLTRHGIAVLRADDRGVGKSTGNFATATSADFASDARSGVEYLKSRKEINSRQIGLIGHSEGGLIAPMVASQTSDVAFIVLMAGTGVNGEEILYRQTDLIARASGVPDETVKTNNSLLKTMLTTIKTETDTAKIEKIVNEAAQELLKSVPEAQRIQVETNLKAQTRQMSSPWFRYFLTFDPATALKKVKCPVLAINGEKDLQVDPKQNLAPIEAALKEGGNMDITIKEFPGLNHLFQKSTTGSPKEYGEIEETINEIALKTMADWILQHTKK